MSSARTQSGSRPNESLTEAVARLVERSWKVVVIVTAAVAVVVLFFVIWEPVQSRAEERAAEQAETAQRIFDAWQAESDDGARDALAQQLGQQVAAILDQYPGRYAAKRALYIRGQYYFEESEWQRAQDDWMAVADGAIGSYLAGLALFNAAIAAEEGGDIDTAILRLEEVEDAYRHTPLPARAIFSTGRIRETAGEIAAAETSYQRLEETYPGSDWATMARNRLLALKISGALEG